MDHHVKGLAVDAFFAGMMEMELPQLVPLSAHLDETSGGIVHLNAMAGIYEIKRSVFVVELDLWQGTRFNINLANVDRRLFFACKAGGELGFQVAPMLRSGCTFVRPLTLSDDGRRQQNPKCDSCTKHQNGYLVAFCAATPIL